MTREIEFPEKDQGLRDDVRLLGALVGDVIREQGGEEFFRRVEAVRAAAIGRREGDAAAAGELSALLRGLEPYDARELVRAFSTYFQMVNLAERVHRIRRRRAYERDPSRVQPQGFADSLARLEALDTGKPLTLAREMGRDLAFSPDGNYLAAFATMLCPGPTRSGLTKASYQVGPAEL